MRAYLLPLFAALLLTPAAAGQSAGPGSAGSIYSGFLIGERVEHGSSRAMMMGGAGIGLRSAAFVNLDNPALWSDGNLVRLSFGAEVEGLRSEDASGERSFLTGSGITALSVTVPLIQNQLGMTASLRPYSRVNYLVIREGQLVEADLPVDTVGYRVNLEGDGGLYETQIGFGWRPAEWLSVGASGRALFGVVEHRQRTEYLAPAGFGQTQVSQRSRMWGFSGTLGAVGTATGVLGDRDVLSVGAAVTLPVNLDSRRTTTLGFSLDLDTLRAEAAGTTNLPMSIAAGVGYTPDARWHVAADVRFEPWTSFDSDFAFPGFNPTTGASDLRDRLRVGGGVEFTPAGLDRNAPYLARAAYRFGGYFDGGYLQTQGENISTAALTGGVSLPGILPGARFDLGLETGTRGTTTGGLVQDLFFRGTATINFGERWFVRRQFG